MCIVAGAIGASVVGGVLAGDAQEDAANAAAGAQRDASAAQIAESRRQFDEIRKLLEPYTKAGPQALTAQQNLIGLGGTAAQQQAIRALETSPQFTSLVKSGENAILQNASATGGLRGGNVQAALAQFRPNILSSLIEGQYAKLGGLTSIGQNAAAGVGNAGMASSSQINQALGNIGSAQAGAALASGQAQANMIGGISQGIGQLAGKLFSPTPQLTGADISAINTYNSGTANLGLAPSSGLPYGGLGF